MSLLLCTNIL